MSAFQAGTTMGHKMLVHIVQAQGLKHMNSFTGDHPYCVCQVKPAAGHGRATQVQTKPVTTGDTLNPFWDERFEVEPVHQGDALEFSVYDKGLIGSKTEGKAVLPSESFFPAGFNGMLPIAGLPGAMLQVAVQLLSGAPVAGVVAGEQQPVVMQAATPGLASTTIAQSTMAPAPVAMSSATTYAASPAPVAMGVAGSPVTSVPMVSSAGLPATTTTYSAPMTAAPAAAPAPMMPYTYAQPQQPAVMSNFMPPMQTYAAAAPAVTYQQQQPVTYSAPTTVTQGSQPLTSGASFVAYPVAMPMGPCKLSVTIVRAQGLHHMNHFTGDHPYVVCEVKHSDRHFGRSTKVETQPVKEGDTLNPVWNETLELEPWHQGEPLEFTVYDKGLIGSKTEGKAILKAESFFPNGFNGFVPVAGLPQAMIHVCVRMMGPSTVDLSSQSLAAQSPTMTTVSPTTAVTTVAEAKKRKKMKKKSKGCC